MHTFKKLEEPNDRSVLKEQARLSISSGCLTMWCLDFLWIPSFLSVRLQYFSPFIVGNLTKMISIKKRDKRNFGFDHQGFFFTHLSNIPLPRHWLVVSPWTFRNKCSKRQTNQTFQYYFVSVFYWSENRLPVTVDVYFCFKGVIITLEDTTLFSMARLPFDPGINMKSYPEIHRTKTFIGEE